jgi:prolipoprotein diacylglyceryltransferase
MAEPIIELIFIFFAGMSILIGGMLSVAFYFKYLADWASDINETFGIIMGGAIVMGGCIGGAIILIIVIELLNLTGYIPK